MRSIARPHPLAPEVGGDYLAGKSTNTNGSLPNGGTIMRALTLVLGLNLTLGLALAPAVAQADYPERIVRVVVPVAAGGGVDVMARLLAQKLSERLRPAVRGREPPRRRRRDRQQGGDRLAARRLHAALHAVAACRSRSPSTRRRPTTSPRISHRSSTWRSAPMRWWCIRRCRRKTLEGVHRLRQGQSRQAELRLGRRRQRLASRRRDCSRARPGSRWCMCPTRA